MAQRDILVRSLKKVAEDAEGENRGWKIKVIIFVGGTSASVHAQTLNDNLKELQVIESQRNAIRKLAPSKGQMSLCPGGGARPARVNLQQCLL